MRIVFLGDISVTGSHAYSPDGLDFLLDADHVIANLEGPILPEEEIKLIDREVKRVLYNAPDVIDTLKGFQVDAVCLANNHIFDHGHSLDFTKKVLAEAGIGYFGAGDNLGEASQPYILGAEGEVVKIFGFGWDVIGCQYARPGRPGVNPYQPDHLLDTIRDLRKTDPESKVIFYIHWNYELERFPQPADRQLARQLIDDGLDAVIGTHPHLAQGGEFYRDKPIVYSLGNWFFPPREFGGYHLEYPQESNRQLGFELEIQGRGVQNARFHWCRFDKGEGTVLNESEEGWDGQTLKALTPYNGMSPERYLGWFRKNRAKDAFLPVYADFRNKTANFLYDQIVRLRQLAIEVLVLLGIKR